MPFLRLPADAPNETICLRGPTGQGKRKATDYTGLNGGSMEWESV
ncbi:hypothetical protein [Bacteroides sp. An269]|nr:hypothetical protein [Bacteroides sp. An269]